MSRLVSSRFPYLPIHLEVRRGVHDLEALIDTGFDGDIAVPLDLIVDGDPPDGHQRWTLLAPFYLGVLRLGATELSDIQITAMGAEPLIGRGIIAHFVVVLDHGQQAFLEP